MECQSLVSSTQRFYPLRIALEDVNDNTPIFVGAPYTVTANEVILPSPIENITIHEGYIMYTSTLVHHSFFSREVKHMYMYTQAFPVECATIQYGYYFLAQRVSNVLVHGSV